MLVYRKVIPLWDTPVAFWAQGFDLECARNIGGTEYCVSVSCELVSHDVIQKLQDLDVDDNT